VESKASEAEKEYLKLVADMETSYKTFENQIQGVEAPGSSKSLAIGAQELVESMHRKLIGYQAGVNKLLSSANKAWVPPRSIDPDAGRIGDIPRTFSSVFREGGSSAIFAVCVLLSLLIDSIPLLLSVLIVKRPEEEDDPYTLN
jgi:hypothetical protein